MLKINKQVTLSRKAQQGAVLIVALVFLTLTALISVSVIGASAYQMKMAGNAQFKEDAFQVVEGVLDGIVAKYKVNLPVTGAVGYSICATGVSGCDSQVIVLPSALTAVHTGVDLNYRAVRQGPLFAPLPFRQDDSGASSAGAFEIAMFELQVEYDGREEKLGHHEVFQGVAIKVASSGQ